MKFDTMTNADVVTELCRRIRTRRIELRMSQEDLASAAQIGIATLKRIEAGQPANLTTTVSLVRALGGIAQLESLLFSAHKAATEPPEDKPATTHRIRKRATPPASSKPPQNVRDDEHDYLLTAQNNVSWGLPIQPNDKEGAR